jgi:DNA-binding NarL/FixJ family response regulator
VDVTHEPRRVRIGVVDDHPLVAKALDGATGGAPGREIRIDLRAVAATVGAAVELLDRDDLDVLVCDLQVGAGADGLLVLEVARRRSIPVLVVSGFDRPVFARAAFERGAAGFVTKGEGVDALVEAIGRVAAGEAAFGERTLLAVRAPGAQPTARELEVIRGIAAGRSTDEIARDLMLSARTVESHVRRLFDRFGVVSRAELAVVAEREGWLSLPAG